MISNPDIQAAVEADRESVHLINQVDQMLYDVSQTEFAENPAAQRVLRWISLGLVEKAQGFQDYFNGVQPEFKYRAVDKTTLRPANVYPDYYDRHLKAANPALSATIAEAIARRLGVVGPQGREHLTDYIGSDKWRPVAYGSAEGYIEIPLDGSGRVLSKDEPVLEPVMGIGRGREGESWSLSVYHAAGFDKSLDTPIQPSKFLQATQ